MAEDAEPKRVKGGRPRKHAPNAKRPTMSFRISSDLHEKLIASAAEGERSLSEEIERRLEASYREPDLVNKITSTAMASVIKSTMEDVIKDFGGPDAYDAGRLFGHAVADRLELNGNYFPNAPEPWYRDVKQMMFISDRLDGVKEAILRSVAEKKRKVSPTDNELFLHVLETAQSLGIQTFGLNQEEVVSKINEYYQNRSANSEEWPDDVKPMR